MKEELRLATQEDTDLLFEWANEEEVRKNSFSTERVLYENHVKWFENILKKENYRQYIYCVEDIPVGQIRLTIIGEKAEIGYSVCACYRRKGHGKRMLQLLRQQIKEELPQVKILVAKVKPENMASRHVFWGLGYQEVYCQYEIEI